MDEAEAVDRAKAGDVNAYEWLVRQHSAAAIRLATSVCGSAADAEDATQEAFIKAFKALDRVRANGAIRPWLLRIVAQEAQSARRATTRRTALAVPVPDPDLFAAAVSDRIRGTQPVTANVRAPARPRRIGVLVAGLTLGLAVAVGVAPVRSAIADLLGIDGVHITRVARLP